MNELTREQIEGIAERGECPECGEQKGFLVGPEGGLTQNIMCGGCGAKFNYCPPCYVIPAGFGERLPK